MNKINKIKTILGMEVKLETMTLENGAVLEADSFEAGEEVFIVSDEERVAMPIGEYELPEDKVMIITQEGVIAEIKDKEAEEKEAPKEEAPVEEEAELEAEVTTPKKIIESISKEQFFSEIEKLRNEINELKQPKVELSEEVEGLSHNPEASTDTKELNLYSQKRKQSTLDRVFKQLIK